MEDKNVLASTSDDLRSQQELFIDFRKLRQSFQTCSLVKKAEQSKREKLKIERSADILDENQPEEIAEEHLRLMLRLGNLICYCLS